MAARIFRMNSKGFNLIEAAIVLGIIGLVIGGIWVAASTVSRNFKLNEVNVETLRMANKIRELFPPGLQGTTNITDVAAITIARNASITPRSWPVNAAGFPVSPLGHELTISFSPADNPPNFSIGYGPLSPQDCIAVFDKLTASARADPAGMLYILLFNSSDYGNVQQYDLTGGAAFVQASTKCGSVNRDLNIYFRY